jgi:hypothetical protein
MQFVDLETLLEDLPETLAAKIKIAIEKKQVKAVTIADGKPTGWPDIPPEWPLGADRCHIVGYTPPGDDKPTSKTKEALRLIDEEELTPYAAAKAVGIDPSIVHRAFKRRQGKNICPCCNQIIVSG